MPTNIEWTDETWNPLAGCSPISPGCTNCYAATMARRLDGMAQSDLRRGKDPGGKRNYMGTAERRGKVDVFNGVINFDEVALLKPTKWKKPRLIFVNSMSDFFHDAVTVEMIAAMLGIMYEAQWHTFQVLTKRAERMQSVLNWPGLLDAVACVTWKRLAARAPDKAEILTVRDIRADLDMNWPLPNVWWGVSVEDQKRADQRIAPLLLTPAAVRFLSYEPALGPLDLCRVLWPGKARVDVLRGGFWEDREVFTKGYVNSSDFPATIDWVVAGGESGDRARPAHPDWFRKVRDDCSASGVAFLFKQWGEFSYHDCVAHGEKEVVFEPGLPMDLRHMLIWDGQSFEKPRAGETVQSAFRAGNHLAIRVGKKEAGRLLDGVEHNEFPIQTTVAA